MEGHRSSRGSILVLAAHPDDEVLGCGGTIARRSDEGFDVTVAIFGEGISSRYSDRDEVDQAELAALTEHAREAGRILGAREVIRFSYPDNRFDSVPLLELVHEIESLVQRLQPAIVYTHSGGDLNIDHQIMFRATLTAARPLVGSPVRELYAYEVASSTEWAFGKFSPSFTPSVFVGVDRTLETKIRAMEVYESERRGFPHPRSPEALRAQARRWGSTVGMPAAEAFEPVRILYE